MSRRALSASPLAVLTAVVAVGGLAVAGPASPAAAAELPRLTSVGSFDQPVYVTAPKGDRNRLFVVEKAGVIRVVKKGRTLAKPFLDLRDLTSKDGEQGLLSMAFSPRYAKNRLFYVNYTDRAGDTRVVEYRARAKRPDVSARGTARVVLRIDQPAPNHNGGQLQFGPDGLLYVGMGDGGGAGDPGNNAQDLQSALGKMLVLPPRGTWARHDGYADLPRVPARSYSGAAAVRPAIAAYGLRNPWRFSFDRVTGTMVIGDVGQDKFEEIDLIPRGTRTAVNFGWRVFEGNDHYTSGRAPGAVGPVLALPHPAYCSITGGYVVRDAGVPALYGRHVYSDFCNGTIRSVSLAGGRASDDRATGLSASSVVSFGEDGRGRVYVVSLNGSVKRLT